jgi:drug/metabolite transporter (DMT)-like permease
MFKKELHSNNTIASIIWIIICKLTFIMMMLQVKEARELPYLQLNFFRGVAIFATSTLLLIMAKKKIFRSAHPWYQIFRAFAGASGFLCFFYVYQHIEFAEASALNFSQSLWAIALAMIFLKEKATWRHWISVLVGYLGVFLVADPNFGTLHTGELVAVIGAALLALENILAKKVVSKDPPAMFMFYSSCVIVSVIGFNYILPFDYLILILKEPGSTTWRSVGLQNIGPILTVAVLSLMSQYAYLRAYKLENVNFLAPFDYTKVIFAMGVDLLLWQVFPTWQTVFGSLLVLGGIYYLAQHRLAVRDAEV